MKNKRTKKVKNIVLSLAAASLMVAAIGGTYSRYASRATVNSNLNLAKWKVVLSDGTNDYDISSQSQTFNINATLDEVESNSNVSAGKLAPGQVLSASLEVDPSDSQVAIDYLLNVGEISTTGFNSTSNIDVYKIVATVDGTSENMVLLDSNYRYFENLTNVLNNKKVSFKICLKWTDEGEDVADTANGINISNITIPVTVTARQHLATDGMISTANTVSGFVSSVAALNANDTLVLQDSVDLRDEFGETQANFLNFADNSTLDLNGNTILSKNKSAIYHGNDLVIENGILETPGSYALFLGGNDVLMDDNIQTSNVTVNNVTTIGGINTDHVDNVVLNNVKATAHKYYAVCGNSYTQITINGGEYTVDNSELTASQISQRALFMMYGVRVANDDAAGNPNGAFTINSGKFVTGGRKFCLTGDKYIAPVIYGGTFDCDVSAYVADGYKCTDQGNGWYIVEPI